MFLIYAKSILKALINKCNRRNEAMNIIEQSYSILEDDPDPVNQIARRARLCYKSEPKTDEKPFLKRHSAHQPIFEMVVVSLLISDIKESDIQLITNLKESKYITVSQTTKNDEVIVTGSIRAWKEFLTNHFNNDIAVILKHYNKFLFSEFKTTTGIHRLPIAVINIDLKSDYLTPEDYKLHKHVAVHFITNRAVSHELVRHRPCSFLQESQRYCRYDQDKFGNEVTFIKPTAFFKDQTNEMQAWTQAMEESEYMYFKLLNMKNVTAQAARTVLPNSCKTEIIVYCSLRQWEHIFNRRTASAAEPSMRELMIPLHKDFIKKYDLFNKPQRLVG